MALILIVDDSSFQRRTIRKIVKAAGHEVLEAANGQEALQMISSQPPDCVLVDLIMPVISGLAILMTLSSNSSKVPVIVITADIQESVHRQCLDLGACAVLNKPVKEKELRSAIERALHT